MGTIPSPSWNAVPPDPRLGNPMRDFLEWARVSLQSLMGSLMPLPAPVVQVSALTSAVLLTWNEIPGAAMYEIFESLYPTYNGEQPFATILANSQRTLVAFVKSGLDGSTKFYYYVRARPPIGKPDGQMSTGVGATALPGGPAGVSSEPAPIDPAFVFLREDFMGGNPSSNSQGENKFTHAGNPQTVDYLALNEPMVNTGIMRFSAPNNGSASMKLTTTLTIGPLGQLHNLKDWQLTLIFRLVKTNDIAVRIGICFPAQTNPDPLRGIWLRYDTGSTAIDGRTIVCNDTQFKLEAYRNRSNLTAPDDCWMQTVLNTNVAVDLNWHRVDFKCKVVGTVEASFDGVVIGNLPSSYFGPFSATAHCNSLVAVTGNIFMSVWNKQNKLNSLSASPNGFSRAANGIVTLQFTAAHSFVVGDFVYITNTGDATINGTWRVDTVPDNTHITYDQSAYYKDRAVTGGGGTAESNAPVNLDYIAFGFTSQVTPVDNTKPRYWAGV